MPTTWALASAPQPRLECNRRGIPLSSVTPRHMSRVLSRVSHAARVAGPKSSGQGSRNLCRALFQPEELICPDNQPRPLEQITHHATVCLAPHRLPRSWPHTAPQRLRSMFTKAWSSAQERCICLHVSIWVSSRVATRTPCSLSASS